MPDRTRYGSSVPNPSVFAAMPPLQLPTNTPDGSPMLGSSSSATGIAKLGSDAELIAFANEMGQEGSGHDGLHSMEAPPPLVPTLASNSPGMIRMTQQYRQPLSQRPQIAGSAPSTEWSASGVGATRKQILHWTRINEEEEDDQQQQDSTTGHNMTQQTSASASMAQPPNMKANARVRAMSKGGMSASFKNLLETLPEVPIEDDNGDEEEEDASEGRPIEDTRDYPNPEVYLGLGGSSVGAAALAHASAGRSRVLSFDSQVDSRRSSQSVFLSQSALLGGSGDKHDGVQEVGEDGSETAASSSVNGLSGGVSKMGLNRVRLASEDDDGGMLFDME